MSAANPSGVAYRSTPQDDRVSLCFPFSGDAIGGSHISTKGLLDHLDTGRFRPIVVPEVADGRIARFFSEFEQATDPGNRSGGFVPGEAFTARKFLWTLRNIGPRVRFLRRNRIDIVHVNDGRTSANWALAARLAGARLVWHHRGDPGAMGLRLVAPLLANRVVSVSSFSLPSPGLWSAARKAEVVHSPFDADIRVDRAAARATLVAELGIDPDTLILGYFGSFVPRKRPLLFVDILARLRQTLDRPCVGLMFGEARLPAMDEALRAHIIDRDVTGTVKLMGYRSPGSFWIAACDQLLVPAIGEPFGRTLVEAMLVGTPVVAARSGGNVEALQGDMGLLVAPDDADAMAEGCIALSRSTDHGAAMAAAAQRDARHRFSEATHCAKISTVYDRLVPDGLSTAASRTDARRALAPRA